MSLQSFWATSREKRGYSGVVTYTREAWAPLAADADCLGDSAEDLLSREGRIVVTDHGVFVLLNVYVPNAGKRGEELSARADLKIRFLRALKAKCDLLTAEGKQVSLHEHSEGYQESRSRVKFCKVNAVAAERL